ncbi:MAG TPA: DUF3883 domain-containing protein [Rhodanobacter sp.]|nr:DUF3883 domain-containing protein [Rhodanobacter sp.]
MAKTRTRKILTSHHRHYGEGRTSSRPTHVIPAKTGIALAVVAPEQKLFVCPRRPNYFLFACSHLRGSACKWTPFYVSRNEIARSNTDADKYRLYRLFDFRVKPRAFQLPGAIGNHCALDPVTYLASFST